MDLRQEEIRYQDGREQSVHCMHRHIKSSNPKDRIFTDLHYHEYIELLYGLEGDAEVKIGERQCTMHSGELVIINAREAHSVACPEGEAKYYVIKFLPKILYSQNNTLAVVRYLLPLWQKEVAFSPIFAAGELFESGMAARLEEIIRESAEKKAGYDLIVQANIMQLFVWMVRRLRPATIVESVLPESLLTCLYRALEAIQQNSADITAVAAARECNLSYSYFCRSFKQAFGLSFSAYLESVRLREGERLLLTTNREITDVAQEVGFGTTSYFIERFRKTYGLSPRVFRMRMRSTRVDAEGTCGR